MTALFSAQHELLLHV